MSVCTAVVHLRLTVLALITGSLGSVGTRRGGRMDSGVCMAKRRRPVMVMNGTGPAGIVPVPCCTRITETMSLKRAADILDPSALPSTSAAVTIRALGAQPDA